jgi:predicted RNA binding protein YcfA (HicA-like mRNA interferase family)
MGHIRRISAKEIESILARYGFELVGQRGSHRKWRNQESRAVVTVPGHGRKEVPIGTVRQIMISAGIPTQEWRTEE